MLAQRIYGLALGYEDLNDHEQLRSDPLLALLSGKRELDEPLAGKSTLNRLELVGRSRSLSQDRLLGRGSGPAAGGSVSWSRIAVRRNRSCWTWTRPTSRSTAISRSGSSTATTTATAICRCISSPATSCCARGCGRPTRMRPPVRWKKSAASLRSCGSAGREVKIVLRADSGFCREELMGWCERQPCGLPVWLARNQRLQQDHRRPDAPGSCPASEHRQGGARLHRVRLYRRARAGRAPAAWWPRPSISTRARTRASWSLR